MHHLIWFRHDLRLDDNTAVYQAFQGADKVTAIFYHCPKQWRQHKLGKHHLDFYQANLKHLAQQLAQHDVQLIERTVDCFDDIVDDLSDFVDANAVDAVFANLEVPIDERRRDKQVQQRLSVPFHRFHCDCVIEPGALSTGSGAMFQVFTPFANKWCAALQQRGLQLTPRPTQLATSSVESEPVYQFGIGELSAKKALAAYCQERLYQYKEDRDYPAKAGTSRLSPYLAIGVLSARQCLAAVQQELGHLPLSRGERGFSWVNELIWRDFYRHLMFDNHELSKGLPFKPHTQGLKWSYHKPHFKAWCLGKTGFPIVDAAMRCLRQTGWMHNRLRMVVASFLTKDLHIDWRWGEAYFMRQLIDADFASNNGGWQWAAGTGADAAPYFRVFNPTTQGERFDKQGEFIKQWIPELSDVPARYIHKPQQWLKQNASNISYPEPIVDHKSAREYAIAMFKALD